MKNLKFHGLLLIVLCFSLPLIGQTDKIKRRTITMETLSDDAETESSEDETSSKFYVAAVKINPLLISIGDFPVSLEYSPIDIFTLEVGLGITFRNLISGDHDLTGADVRYTPGYSLIMNFKWFPYEDAFDDGGYYSLQYSRRVYNREYTLIPYSDQVYGEQDIKEAYTLIYGWQYFFNRRFFIDGYMGLGFEKEKGTRLVEAFDQSGNLVGYASYNYTSEEEDGFLTGFSNYVIPFGIKLGYMF